MLDIDEAALKIAAEKVKSEFGQPVLAIPCNIGDKTLVDAFVPFASTLSAEVGKGKPLAEAWAIAAEVATQAADATEQLTPKLGRAKSHTQRSLGHPDAGAISLALCARVVAEAMKA